MSACTKPATGKLGDIALNQIAADSPHVHANYDEPKIAEFQQRLRDGEELDPVLVYQDADGRTYRLADGWDRREAARREGYKFIRARIMPGTAVDALLAAISENSGARQRRWTKDDAKNAARLLLANDDTKGWSSNMIAKRVGLTHPTVEAMRKSYLVNLQDRDSEAVRTVTRGDQTYEMRVPTSKHAHILDDLPPDRRERAVRALEEAERQAREAQVSSSGDRKRTTAAKVTCPECGHRFVPEK